MKHAAKLLLVMMLMTAFVGPLISVAQAKREQKRVQLHGEVTAVAENSFTLTTDKRTVTILLTANSQIKVGTTAGSLSDIKVGVQVRVRGSKNQDGSVTAKLVRVKPEREKKNEDKTNE